MQLEDVLWVGENDAYIFGVGRIGKRWVGFARDGRISQRRRAAFQSEGLDTEPGMVFVFSEISDGYELGVLDRARAILLTGAIAEDGESLYGGVSRWFVPNDLRGDPEKFRCRHCERVGCDGSDCQGDFYGDF